MATKGYMVGYLVDLFFKGDGPREGHQRRYDLVQNALQIGSQ